MVICLARGADLHMAQLMPLPLTASCFSKIHIGFTFLVSAHPGSPGQRAVKRGCECVCVCVIRPHHDTSASYGLLSLMFSRLSICDKQIAQRIVGLEVSQPYND